MTARVAGLWRHPIKAHGREQVAGVALHPGQTMPWDRVWAVAHEKSQADGSQWVSCGNFTRAASKPELMAITCKLDEATETVTLSHPDLPDLTLAPDREEARFLDWIAPLVEGDARAPARIVRAAARGMTDSDFPSITLCNLASHRAVEERLGRPLSIHRWRGNVWLDGPEAWEEFDWVGREIRLGTARLEVVERTGRCRATEADPETGKRDADTLGTLRSWGHTDFSVMARVTRAGEVAEGDRAELL